MKKINRDRVLLTDAELCGFQDIGELACGNGNTAQAVIKAWDSLTPERQITILSRMSEVFANRATYCQKVMKEIANN